MRTPLENITGNAISLKRLSPGDLKDMHSYVSDSEVSRYIGWPLTETEAETEAYLQKLLVREAEGTHIYSSIVAKGDNRHIGTVMVFNFDDEAKHAEIGYVIHRDFWGRGITSEVLGITVDFCFNILQLNKLHARIVADNIASEKVVKNNGFELEGRLKDYYSIEGKLCDGLIYGLLNKNPLPDIES